ncbi:MAG TPA: saccharopine dehydrogenase NADP-binding domain-containing protein [Erysipelothrix sp.]|nr:saccharopine dehydrogenase NADP-binding domain-containing protein [Erysipelothrix sp.]
MKIIVIGAGGVGSGVALDLSSAKELTLLGIGDIDFERATEVANELGEKAKPVHVDIYDEKKLRNVIKDYDVVVNATGPFYKTARFIIEACIDEKIDYVDIADDSSAVSMLLEYEDACSKAEIAAVICAGASPGSTNMFGKYGSELLDTTDEIHTNWVVSSLGVGDPSGATLWHAIEMSTGTCPQFLDGELKEVESVSGKVDVDFGGKLGAYPIYYVGHGEPLTLSRSIPGVKTVTNRGNLWPASSDISFYKTFEEFGLTLDKPILIRGKEVNRFDLIVDLVNDITQNMMATQELPDYDIGSASQVHVIGTKDNKKTEYKFSRMGPMNMSTALPCSYAAQEVAKRKGEKFGLFAPEEYLDAVSFFKYLMSKGNEYTVEKIVEGTTVETKPLVL